MNVNLSDYCLPFRTEYAKPYMYAPVVCFLLVGLVTNVLILVAVLRSHKLRKNAYIVLVLLLCISDIVLCINCFSYILYFNFKVKSGKVNRIECHVVLHFFLSGIATSLGQTLLICINRLLVSVENVKINKSLFHQRRKYISTTIVFFAVQLYFLIIFAFRGEGDEVDHCDFCTLYFSGHYTVALVLVNLLFSGLYFAVLVSYILAICFIKSRSRKIIPGQSITMVSVIRERVDDAQNGEESNTQNVGKQTKFISRSISRKGPRYVLTMKAMKTLGILLLLLSILTLPFITVWILISVHFNVPTPIRSIAMVFVLLSCTTNPFLYTWRFPELRVELMRIFRIKRSNFTN